jgi:hypothetical protein
MQSAMHTLLSSKKALNAVLNGLPLAAKQAIQSTAEERMSFVNPVRDVGYA